MLNPKATIEILNEMNQGNMVGFLGIEYTEVGEDYICAKMPVNERTVQQLGMLHGGASVVLAETLGSVAANLSIDFEKQYAAGLEVNANHVTPVMKDSGYVYAKATPLHVGRKTHIWEIKITNENKKLVCVSRLTVAIMDKK